MLSSIEILQQLKTIIFFLYARIYSQYIKFFYPKFYEKAKEEFDEKCKKIEEKKKTLEEIQKQTKKQTDKIIDFATKNQTYIDKMKAKFNKSFECRIIKN